jgi:predicted NBD/HSP70 family sugar kinase
MPSVLVLGIDPHAVPGLDGDAWRAVLDQELARFGEHAIDAAMTLVALDESAGPAIVTALTRLAWDVVVIGGGIRKPEPLLEFFEQVVNLVRQHAPGAAIAFNTTGGDSVEAARRWLPGHR